MSLFPIGAMRDDPQYVSKEVCNGALSVIYAPISSLSMYDFSILCGPVKSIYRVTNHTNNP